MNSIAFPKNWVAIAKAGLLYLVLGAASGGLAYEEHEQANPMIEGDLTLLNAVRDLQKANAARFPTGKLSARVTESFPEEEKSYSANFTMIWQGGLGYWTVEENEQDGKKILSNNRQTIQVQTDKLLMHYEPALNRLGTAVVALGRVNSVLEVMPSKAWHRYGARTWEVMLDPKFGGPLLKTVTISQPKPHLVRVVRTGTISEMEIDCDLHQGGNVVRYESRCSGPDCEERRRTGHYEWAPHGDSFQLKAHSYKSEWKQASKEYALVIENFDPSFVVTKNQFTLEAMHLAEGTRCYERTPLGIKETIYGRRSSADRLNYIKLSRMLKEGAFLKRK